MSSTYPGALDTLSTTSANSTPSLDTHPALHNDANSAINAIQAELGVNPSGAAATVVARLDALDTSIAGVGGSVLQVDVIHVAASPFSWVEHPLAKWHDVLLIGGGGGGGSGGVTAAANSAPGAGSGAPGCFVRAVVLAGVGNQTVTVGAGGAGAAAHAGATAQNGTAGGTTSFGSILTALGGNTNTTTNGGGARSNGYLNGGLLEQSPSGAAAGATPAGLAYVMPTGGGGSGGITAASPGTEAVGRDGGEFSGGSGNVFGTPLSGGTGGAVRANGNAGVSVCGYIGTGGGGGGANNTGVTNGGAGGAGGLYGGGGGAGGAARAGATSGAGGAGGAGIAIITQYG